MLRFKAILLSLIFFFGGSGLSVDIAQCCNSFTGVSIGFGGTHQDHSASETDDCCACLTSKKKKRECCEDVVIQTVINQVLSTQKTIQNQKQVDVPLVHVSSYLIPNVVSNKESEFGLSSKNIKEQVPILLRKRVLQI
ncbi:MAG TPA: hypothetical protein VGF79_13965 [Bacteroidia bacterium]